MIKKIILGILALIVFTLISAFLLFNREIDGQVKDLTAQRTEKREIISEEMLKDLPSPVQRYLRYSGIIGKPSVNYVRLKQTGQMKPSPQGNWFSFVADEYYTTNPPAFIWHVKGPRGYPFVLQGRDTLVNGQGRMLIKLLSLFPVANAAGAEISQGAMLRYLNEMMWFPSAFLGDNITWKGIDENSAMVTLKINDKSVSATIYFDEEGKLTNFISQRYMTLNGQFSLETWETPITAYSDYDGYKLPSKGSAVWKLRDGDYKYIDLSIEDVVYE